MMNNIVDLTIIGAGPVGMHAAFIAGLKKMNVKIIDSLEEVGGQLAAFYPEKYIYDLPAVEKILAKDYVAQLNNQLKQVDEYVQLDLGEQVDYVNKRDDRIFEICTDKACHLSKSILIVSGKGAFEPRKLEVDGAEQASNINYFVKNMRKFKGKKVVIFGGGDSAVDWANMLDGVAEEVTLVHRREKFRAHEANVDKLRESNATIYTSYVATELNVENDVATSITIEHAETKEAITLETDELIVLFGFLSTAGPIQEWELDLEKNALKVNQKQETSISGIYAAGDACTYDGKVHRITTGLGESITAVNAALKYTRAK